MTDKKYYSILIIDKAYELCVNSEANSSFVRKHNIKTCFVYNLYAMQHNFYMEVIVMLLQHNIGATNAKRMLGIRLKIQKEVTEKLSSG